MCLDTIMCAYPVGLRVLCCVLQSCILQPAVAYFKHLYTYHSCVMCAIVAHLGLYTQLYTTIVLSYALHKIAVEDCVHYYISPSHASRSLVFSYHITVTIYK